MKRLTAMLLVLCVLSAAVPALGEDYSGTWYVTMADVTVAYIRLNGDGTAEMRSFTAKETITGTWTADGDIVTITAKDKPMDFVFDGTSLTNDESSPLTREEGKLPLEVVTRIMSGEEYELPEGMTEWEMTKIVMNFAKEYMKHMGQDGHETGGDGGTGSETAGQGNTEPVATME